LYRLYLPISRSLFAFCSICTILFSDLETTLSPIGFMNKAYDTIYVSKFNFFTLTDNLFLLKIIAILALTFVILGFYPRITALFQWWISWSLSISLFFLEGGDQVPSNLSLLFIPLCLIDSRKNHWSGISSNFTHTFIEKNIIKYAHLLVLIQVAVIYLIAGVSKFDVLEWKEGTALYYWFTNNNFGAPDYLRGFTNLIANNRIVMAFLTWGIMLLEIAIAFGIFATTRYRNAIFILGVFLHTAIFVFIGLFTFSLAMIACLIIFCKPSFFNHFKFKLCKTI
jgi:antimicrobial peptide system SdpB family protein